jgi:hypothetical protein
MVRVTNSYEYVGWLDLLTISYTRTLNYNELQAVPALLLLIYTLQFTVANALGFLCFH